MRSNIKTIKVTAWLSLLLIAITYLISIRKVLGVQELECLPDTFLLAVFGGTFASMLVVLICEISKYFQNRESTETYLFSHLYYLYGQLQIIKKNIDFLSQQKDRIHEDALTRLITNSEAEMNTIFFADYIPFRKNNAVFTEKTNYNTKVYPIIQQFLQDCRLLKMAVLTDKITITQREMGNHIGADNNADLVLIKLSEQIREPLSLIDELLTKIDQLCHGRYNWAQVRDDMITRIPDNQTDSLEQFLKKE